MNAEMIESVRQTMMEELRKKGLQELARQQREEQLEEDARQAYVTFKPVVESVSEFVASYEVAPSTLASKKPCARVTDRKGRLFEIHYHKSVFHGYDYNVNSQWRDKSWLDYSVSLTEKGVCEVFGRWLAQD